MTPITPATLTVPHPEAMTDYTREQAADHLRISVSSFTKFLSTYRELNPDYQPAYAHRGRQVFTHDVVALIGQASRRCAAQPVLTRQQALEIELGRQPDSAPPSNGTGAQRQAAAQPMLLEMRRALEERQQLHADLRALLVDIQQSQAEILRRLQSLGA